MKKEMNEKRMFQVGDEVRVENEDNSNYSEYHTGDTFIVGYITESLSNGGYWLNVKSEDAGDSIADSCCRLVKLNSIHQVGTIFSVLNEKEAEAYIGRMVEGCDPTEYRKGKWDKVIFEKLRGDNSDYPFAAVDGEIYTLIRLIPESFEAPKPKVDPGLIKALKLSIQQWQIMYDTDKSKFEVYRFLGGDTEMSCFLCNFVGVRSGGNRFDCKRCIDWKADYCHSSKNSPFHDYREDDSSKPAQLKVLDHLKSELARLESESK